MRRHLLPALCGVCATSGIAYGANDKFIDDDGRAKPNIILIMTDQHRFDCIGAMGNSTIKTPNIDSLAGNGVLFTNGYTSAPSSTPARAVLLTGMSPWNNGMLGYGAVAQSYRYEMPRMLTDNGYYTHVIGKLHYTPQRHTHGYHSAELDESGRVEFADFESDYRKWFKEQAKNVNPDSTGIGWNEHTGGSYALDQRLHPTTWTAQRAVEFISHYQQESPLFLKISFARPHSPYDPPKRLYQMYDSVPAPYTSQWSDYYANREKTKDAPYGDFGLNHALDSRRYYYGSVSFIDEKVGEIVHALKQQGLYDNSLIFFISDHGDMLGDHNHWRKTYPYEGSSHIPYIVKFPDFISSQLQQGTALEQVVELRDILPTMLDACGAEIPEKMDGRSLIALYQNPKTPWRQYIDLEHTASYDPKEYWAALTDGKMKYIYFFPNGAEQLFDISDDKSESIDLSGDAAHSTELALWRKRLTEHLSPRGEEYVKNGKLQIINKNILYSPNYPR